VRRAQRYARLTVPYYNAGWITLDERDYLQHRIFVEGMYEPEVWEALSRFAVRGEVFWDIGAHIGAFSIPALHDPRVQEVHAFEPDSITYEILRTNLSLNAGRVTAHPFALADRLGERTLYRGPARNSGQASLKPVGRGSESHSVSCHTVDDLVEGGLQAPTLLKLDVEGSERAVLAGARASLTSGRLRAVVLEAESDGSGAMVDRELSLELADMGLSVAHVPRPEGVIESRENYLAVPKTAR
jgi:FkbM family methyltransferase